MYTLDPPSKVCDKAMVCWAYEIAKDRKHVDCLNYFRWGMMLTDCRAEAKRIKEIAVENSNKKSKKRRPKQIETPLVFFEPKPKTRWLSDGERKQKKKERQKRKKENWKNNQKQKKSVAFEVTVDNACFE